MLAVVGGAPTTDETSIAVDYWEAFWTLYPRRVARKDARLAWAKIDPKLHVQVLTALAAWRPILMAKGAEYCPYPASWLNGERWDDEMPAGVSQGRPAAHVPLPDDPTAFVRGELPDKVKAMVAKLKLK